MTSQNQGFTDWTVPSVVRNASQFFKFWAYSGFWLTHYSHISIYPVDRRENWGHRMQKTCLHSVLKLMNVTASGARLTSKHMSATIASLLVIVFCMWNAYLDFVKTFTDTVLSYFFSLMITSLNIGWLILSLYVVIFRGITSVVSHNDLCRCLSSMRPGLFSDFRSLVYSILWVMELSQGALELALQARLASKLKIHLPLLPGCWD